MRFNFSVVLCKKKNPIWGSVVDGYFQTLRMTVLSGTEAMPRFHSAVTPWVGNAHLQQNFISDSYNMPPAHCKKKLLSLKNEMNDVQMSR